MGAHLWIGAQCVYLRPCLSLPKVSLILQKENIGLGKIGDSYPAKPSPSALDPSHHKSTNEATSSLGHALTSLPSSVTTLLLSIVDSPAYANLTSDYLNNTFNPATPDNPHVKYYSVAGRMDSVNVWHPFWLPKMVLDGWEQNQRTKERKNWEEYIKGTSLEDKTHTPRWASDREWGNDGLVTVQSAKWGEFLGIMEGCDREFLGSLLLIYCTGHGVGI